MKNIFHVKATKTIVLFLAVFLCFDLGAQKIGDLVPPRPDACPGATLLVNMDNKPVYAYEDTTYCLNGNTVTLWNDCFTESVVFESIVSGCPSAEYIFTSDTVGIEIYNYTTVNGDTVHISNETLNCKEIIELGLDICALIGTDSTSWLACADCDVGGISNWKECSIYNTDPSFTEDDYITELQGDSVVIGECDVPLVFELDSLVTPCNEGPTILSIINEENAAVIIDPSGSAILYYDPLACSDLDSASFTIVSTCVNGFADSSNYLITLGGTSGTESRVSITGDSDGDTITVMTVNEKTNGDPVPCVECSRIDVMLSVSGGPFVLHEELSGLTGDNLSVASSTISDSTSIKECISADGVIFGCTTGSVELDLKCFTEKNDLQGVQFEIRLDTYNGGNCVGSNGVCPVESDNPDNTTIVEGCGFNTYNVRQAVTFFKPAFTSYFNYVDENVGLFDFFKSVADPSVLPPDQNGNSVSRNDIHYMTLWIEDPNGNNLPGLGNSGYADLIRTLFSMTKLDGVTPSMGVNGFTNNGVSELGTEIAGTPESADEWAKSVSSLIESRFNTLYSICSNVTYLLVGQTSNANRDLYSYDFQITLPCDWKVLNVHSNNLSATGAANGSVINEWVFLPNTQPISGWVESDIIFTPGNHTGDAEKIDNCVNITCN